MNTKIKVYKDIFLNKIFRDPKKFYFWAMAFLIVSFIGTLIQGIFFPQKYEFTIKPPTFYHKSDKIKTTMYQNETRIQNVVDQLKALNEKRIQTKLTKADSARIEYLYNQYQTLKNGH